MIRTTTSFAMGAVVALVLGTGTAYAATGGKFIIGRSNTATTTTTLSNSGGTALVLNSRAGQPSLRVNRNTKVPNLNADLLDGLDQGAFARVTKIGTITAAGEVDDNGTADTTDDVVAAYAICPAGSQVVGGGAADGTDDGAPVASFPDRDPSTGVEAYVVYSSATTTTAANAANLVAFARCYNPRGNVASNARVAPKRYTPSAAARAMGAAAAAKH